MNIYYLLALALGIAGAANLMVLSFGFTLAGWRKNTLYPLAGGLALIGAAAVFIVSMQNFGVIENSAVLEAAEAALTLAAGPLFYLLFAAIIKMKARVGAVIAPAAAAAFIFAAMQWSDIRPAVLVQIAYSAAAAIAGWRRLQQTNMRPPLAALALLSGAAALHMAQITRMALPDIAMLSGVVPLTLSAVAFAVVAFAARRLANGWVVASHQRAPALNIERLRSALTDGEAYLQPDYRLADLAAAAKVSPAAASATINRETGGGFVRFLNRERLTAARRLLASPEETETSIEAVALLSGFRSRSAFYRAFKEEYGVSPASVRCVKYCPDKENGTN